MVSGGKLNPPFPCSPIWFATSNCRRCFVLVAANVMGTKPQRSRRRKNYSCGIALKFGLVPQKTTGTLYL